MRAFCNYIGYSFVNGTNISTYIYKKLIKINANTLHNLKRGRDVTTCQSYDSCQTLL